MVTRIQVRRDTANNWTNVNPILASGELGYETDTAKLKIGDGTTSWKSLDYFGGELSEIPELTTSNLLLSGKGRSVLISRPPGNYVPAY